MDPLAFRSATELLRDLDAGELSSCELLERLLERIARLDPAINAVVTLDAERARKRAEEADAARARGERWGPLHGLPMTVKDCYETAGLRTTAGAPQLREHIPAHNAVAVQRLLDAGAIVFGKTNTPPWAMDWQTTNELFGTTNNPWDLERTPGGSSGGSAAAVAAGFSPLELGSDIGGSIRIPAHCCGVFGHKPSWGIVPERGHIPGLPGSRIEADINVVGPLARSPEDLELALDVLAGPLPQQARAWQLALPAPRAGRLADYRVAAWLEQPGFPVAAAVRERLEATVDALRRAGVSVDTEARPAIDFDEALDLYRRMLAPVVTGTMTDEFFGALLESGEASGQADDPVAAFTRQIGVRHRDWLALHERREQLRESWDEFFADFDLLLCPISPVPAIRHDHSEPQLDRTIEVDGAPRPYTDHFTWMGTIGVVHLPATAAPAGPTPEGLPVGVQIVGPYLEDRSCLDFARRLAGEIGGFRPPPSPDGLDLAP